MKRFMHLICCLGLGVTWSAHAAPSPAAGGHLPGSAVPGKALAPAAGTGPEAEWDALLRAVEAEIDACREGVQAESAVYVSCGAIGREALRELGAIAPPPER